MSPAVWKIDTRELDRIIAGLGAKKRKIVTRQAYILRDNARNIVPKDTTALMRSIHVKTDDDDGSADAYADALAHRPGITYEELPDPEGDVIAVVGTGWEYAEYNEFGTSKMAARPFIGPSAELVRKNLSDPATWKELIE